MTSGSLTGEMALEQRQTGHQGHHGLSLQENQGNEEFIPDKKRIHHDQRYHGRRG